MRQFIETQTTTSNQAKVTSEQRDWPVLGHYLGDSVWNWLILFRVVVVVGVHTSRESAYMRLDNFATKGENIG